MTQPKTFKLDTLALHAGHRPDSDVGARAVPIYQTTSYVFPDTDRAAALFNLERPGHVYSRISNPTVAVLEERVAALEQGVAAVATASGQAALFLAVTTLMGQGGHIVASRQLYGGSVNLLTHTLPRFGIETSFVDPRDPAAFRDAIRPETRLVFGEVIGNPGLEVMDVAAVAEVAHAAGLPLLIDSTFTTPYLMKPIAHGADLIMHSATKWLGGHGVAVGGVLVDGGRFDWMANDKFPSLSQPYAGYHGVTFTEEFGPQAFAMRARMEGLRDFGAAMSPQTAFYLLQGIETLALRMARHMENTHKVLDFLEGHEQVAWVQHPDLADHPDHALTRRQLPKGAGSIVAFGVKGGEATGDARLAGRAFIEACGLASHLANVGDAKTLVIHPASTTQQQMSAEELAAAGIGADMIRLSVGLEDAEDIVADLTQALRAAAKA